MRDFTDLLEDDPSEAERVWKAGEVDVPREMRRSLDANRRERDGVARVNPGAPVSAEEAERARALSFAETEEGRKLAAAAAREQWQQRAETEEAERLAEMKASRDKQLEVNRLARQPKVSPAVEAFKRGGLEAVEELLAGNGDDVAAYKRLMEKAGEGVEGAREAANELVSRQVQVRRPAGDAA